MVKWAGGKLGHIANMVEDETYEKVEALVVMGGINDIQISAEETKVETNFHCQKLFNAIVKMKPKKTIIVGPYKCPEQIDFTDSYKIVDNRMRRASDKLMEMGINSSFISLANEPFDDLNDFDDSIHLNKEGTEKLIKTINDHTDNALQEVTATDNKRNGHLATRYGCMRCGDRLHNNKQKGCSVDFTKDFTLKWLDGAATNDETTQPGFQLSTTSTPATTLVCGSGGENPFSPSSTEGSQIDPLATKPMPMPENEPANEDPVSLPPVVLPKGDWAEEMEIESQAKSQRQPGPNQGGRRKDKRLSESKDTENKQGGKGDDDMMQEIDSVKECVKDKSKNRENDVDEGASSMKLFLKGLGELDGKLVNKDGDRANKQGSTLKSYLKGLGDEVKALKLPSMGSKIDILLEKSAIRPRLRSENRSLSLSNQTAIFSAPFGNPLSSPGFNTPKALKPNENLSKAAKSHKRNNSFTPPEALHTSVKRRNNSLSLSGASEREKMVDDALQEIRGILGESSDVDLTQSDVSDSLLDDDESTEHRVGTLVLQ